METIEAIVVMSLSAYILGLLLAGWMFNRQTKLVEHFKLDNDQLELENLTLKQQAAAHQRRNKELKYRLEEIEQINNENNKSIAVMNNHIENYRSDILRLMNLVEKKDREKILVHTPVKYEANKTTIK
jgi:lipopolysaccharide export LptBFGC system permease protein LptF